MYHAIKPMALEGKPKNPGPPPQLVMLAPEQLVINAEYQRQISKRGNKLILAMATDWDWAAFKAPSVAATDEPDKFEVVDGQHTAIAAATNGRIKQLPCLLMQAETTAAKARGFIGINRDRIALTPAALFQARVVAEEPAAVDVDITLKQAGVKLLALPPLYGKFLAGETMAVGTLLDISKRRGPKRLLTLLNILVEAKAAPISACMLKALDLAMPLPADADSVQRMTAAVKGQGPARLEIMAKAKREFGQRAYEILADWLAEFAKLPKKRMGR